jgi:hypothetical protein
MRSLPILCLFAPLGFGCECGLVSQPEAFRLAKAVFDGVVVNVHHFENEEQRKMFSRVLVTIKVNEHWKGNVKSTIKVHAWERAIMCDSYKFEQGKRYIVYAIEQDSEGGWWANQYPKGTKILAVGDCILRIAADADVPHEAKLLGKGKPLSSN